MFLDRILDRSERLVIGLSSGTSMDGMDAALVRVTGSGENTSFEIAAFRMTPYPRDLRERLRAASCPDGGTTGEICRLNVEVAELAAGAALDVAREGGVGIEDVDLIGSHGQTVCHLPDDSPGASLQIGEAAVIAERAGVTTVSNFRARDLAAGGQGAPLVPYVDWLLFRSEHENRAMLNLGGIANVTLIPKARGLEALIAFDTGPGNMIIDSVARKTSGGRDLFDRDGERAAQGHPVPEILERCLADSYFGKAPPKSTGRETFGEAFVEDLLMTASASGVSDEDLLATATEFTARTVAEAILDCGRAGNPADRVIASGGGVHNRTLMNRLPQILESVPVVSIEDLGVASDAKEALAFAILANEAVSGVAANVPCVTGARRRVVLGQITPGH